MIKTQTIDTMTAETRLRAAFLIGDADLDDNRHGRLSQSQKKRIGWESAIQALILFGFTLALVWPLTRADLNLEQWSRDPASWIWLLLIAGLLALNIWEIRRTFLILSQGQVKTVNARFTRDILNSAPYIITVPKHQFKVDRAVYQAFVDQADYTFYYVPALNRLVAAEGGAALRVEKESL